MGFILTVKLTSTQPYFLVEGRSGRGGGGGIFLGKVILEALGGFQVNWVETVGNNISRGYITNVHYMCVHSTGGVAEFDGGCI